MMGSVQSLHWYCDICNKGIGSFILCMKTMEVRQGKLEKRVDDLVEAMAKLETGLEKVFSCVSEVKGIRKEVAETNVKFDTVIVARLASEDDANIEKKMDDKVKVVKEDLAEKMEIEKRKHNIVLWGLLENGTNESNIEGAKSKDLEAVNEVLKKGLKIDAERHVIEVHRIGKLDSGKARPMRVKIQTLEARSEIIARARTLKDSDEYKNIYVSPDLTRKQQKDDKELRYKLKEIRQTNQFARINQGRIVAKDANGQIKVLFSLEGDAKAKNINVSKNDVCLGTPEATV